MNVSKMIWAVFSTDFQGEAIVFATTKETIAKSLADTLNMLKSAGQDEFVVHHLPLVDKAEEIDVLVKYEVFVSQDKVLSSNKTAIWQTKGSDENEELTIVFDKPGAGKAARAISLESEKHAIEKAKKALKNI